MHGVSSSFFSFILRGLRVLRGYISFGCGFAALCPLWLTANSGIKYSLKKVKNIFKPQDHGVKACKGAFFTGEVIDVDAKTGGYNSRQRFLHDGFAEIVYEI